MNPNEKHEFDRRMREKFEGFTPEVPAGLWSKIEEKLDVVNPGASKVVPIVEKLRRSSFWWMSAAAILVVGGMAYWLSRPMEVVYLQGKMIAPDEILAPVIERPAQAPEVVHEPLDTDRLKALFAKKTRKTQYAAPKIEKIEKTEEEQMGPGLMQKQQLIAMENDRPEPLVADVADDTTLNADLIAIQIAKVPELPPLIMEEGEEETMLAATDNSRSFGISNILNYVVGTVDQREEKLVTFSNDDEGSLKLDFNFGLAKNRKKKME